jgi:uncharacterized protein (TIGR02246 family)
MAASVRELLRQSTEAVLRRDVAAVAKLYHPNAALHVPGADLVVGREGISEHFTKLLAGQPSDLEHDVTEEHLHEVTPDLAIVDTVGTSRWGNDEGGIEGFTMIAVRDDSGEWLWAGVRGALVPQ